MSENTADKKTAQFVKSVHWGKGDMRLYRLYPPHIEAGFGNNARSIDCVLVSAAEVLGAPETYIFESSSDGSKVIDWAELAGSYQGGLSHEAALSGMGYDEITDATS